MVIRGNPCMYHLCTQNGGNHELVPAKGKMRKDGHTREHSMTFVTRSKKKQNTFFYNYIVNSDWYNAFLQGYNFTHEAKKTQGVGIIQASRYPQISRILGILPKTNSKKPLQNLWLGADPAILLRVSA